MTPQSPPRSTGPRRPFRQRIRRARRTVGLLALIGVFISGCVAVAAQERDHSVGVASGVRGADPTPMPEERRAASVAAGTPLPARAAAAAAGLPPAALDGPEPSTEDDEPFDEHATLVAHAVVDSIVARDRPSADGDLVATFAHPTERGGPLVFQALGPPDGDWLEVLLPVRPNGTTGWIPLEEVELTVNPYRIEIDMARFRLTVLRRDVVQLTTEVGLGTGETPTPIGDFYLMELLKPSTPTGPYGPYAYGLSGYSNTLESFNGGEGVIGIHGTNQPDLLGGPVSHGCIRVANDMIEEMTDFLPLGTPVHVIGPGEADQTAGPVRF